MATRYQMRLWVWWIAVPAAAVTLKGALLLARAIGISLAPGPLPMEPRGRGSGDTIDLPRTRFQRSEFAHLHGPSIAS